MTGYCSVADVRAVLAPQIVDEHGDLFPDTTAETAAQLIDTQIRSAIDSASARVDTYLRVRYTVPVAALNAGVDVNPSDYEYPPSVRYWTRDLAAFDATLTLMRGLPVGADEPVRLRQAQALLDLAAVRDGKMDAGAPTSETPSGQEGFSGVVTVGAAGTFDATDFGGRPGWWDVYGSRPGYDY